MGLFGKIVLKRSTGTSGFKGVTCGVTVMAELAAHSELSFLVGVDAAQSVFKALCI